MAAVTSAVIAGSALAYSVYSGERQRSDAKKAARKQEQELAQQESELEQQAANEDQIEKAEAARDAQAAQQGITRRKQGGRQGTLLNAPQAATNATIGGAGNQGATLIGG